MKVFYTASFYGKKKYQKYYDVVRKAIKITGVQLVSPEEGNYLSVLKLSDYAKIKRKKKLHYEAIRRGILWADVVIIEISHEDFQLGHEATLAIESKKPVLCLSIYEDMSQKISNPYFFGVHYNEHNIEIIISDFIEKNKKESLDSRFNLFLSSKQLDKLDLLAKEKNMNKSEYIRMVIDAASK